MNKLTYIISILFFLILGVPNALALPTCKSSGTFHNCQGTYTFTNGDKYVGEWKGDKKHGQGIYTFTNGEEYVGEFKNGKFHGQGTFTLIHGVEYVGEWKDNKRTGMGTITFADGAKWVGEWKNNKLNGYAITYNADGSIYQEGIFKDDKFLYAQKKKKLVSQVELLTQIMQNKNPEWTEGQSRCFAKETKKGLNKELFDEFFSMLKKGTADGFEDAGVLTAVFPVIVGVSFKCGIQMDLGDGSINQQGILKKSKLDKHKEFCEEIEFTPKTESFGNCVPKLMDKD